MPRGKASARETRAPTGSDPTTRSRAQGGSEPTTRNRAQGCRGTGGCKGVAGDGVGAWRAFCRTPSPSHECLAPPARSSLRDEPYYFTVGSATTIPAFSEAVMGMKKGGLVRIEVPGELMEELAYSLNRAQRYNGKTYIVGPQPQDFGGARALDFVLDNKNFDKSPFNRTLVFDISLLSVSKKV